eukprot:SAG11_NODE_2537_length_3244_cov_2.430843_2_plen_618_part_00
MSTTTDKAVALHYGVDRDRARNLGYVMEFEMDSLNRGALIQWLSQYPGECEVLFAPLTGLEKQREGTLVAEGGAALRHLRFRPTTNQRAVRIEELVARRKTMQLSLLENTRLLLAATGFPPELLDLLDEMHEGAAAMGPGQYNDDGFYRRAVDGAIDLKGTLERLKPELDAVAKAAHAGDTPPPFEPGADEEARRASLCTWLDADRDGVLSRAEFERAERVLGRTGEPLGDADWAARCAQCGGADETVGIPIASLAASALWREQTAERLRHHLAREVLLRSLCDKPNAMAATLTNVAALAAVDPLAGRLALAARRRVLGEDHPATMESMQTVGERLVEDGAYATAAALLEEAARRGRAVLGVAHAATLRSAHFAGEARWRNGEYAAATKLLGEALEGRRKTLGREHADTLASLYEQATVLDLQRQYAKAQTCCEEALLGRQRVLGHEHKDTLKSISAKAILLQETGKFEEARELNEQVLEVRRRTLGDEHNETLKSLTNLAKLLASSHFRKYDEARALLEEALAAKRRTLGDEHPDTLHSLTGLAQLLKRHFKDCATARLLYEEALAVYKRTVGDRNWETVDCARHLYDAYDQDLSIASGALDVARRMAELQSAHGF